MTKTHTVREWLEQLPEPYRTQALENTEKLPRSGYLPLNEPCGSMSVAIFTAFPWSLSPQEGDYWSDAWGKFVQPPFREPQQPTKSPIMASDIIAAYQKIKQDCVTIPGAALDYMLDAALNQANSALSNLLDPSEGWTQEGFAWRNEHGDDIQPCLSNAMCSGWMDIRVKGETDILSEVFVAPSVLSAMAMVNQYRREQWR